MSMRAVISGIALLIGACGASAGSQGSGLGMQEGTPAQPGAVCRDRPAPSSCDDGYQLCNVVSELDGCAYPECVPEGQCPGAS